MRTPSKTIPDQEIVDLMNSGTLRLDTSHSPPSVYKRNAGTSQWHHLHLRTNRNRNNVNLRLGGHPGPHYRQRTVYLNQLLWMWHHRQPIPDGHVINHKNLDRTDDRLDNLELQTREESDRQGWLAMRNEPFSFQERRATGLPLYTANGDPLYF